MRSKKEIAGKTKQIMDAARKDFIGKRSRRSYKNCDQNDFVLVRDIGKIHYCKLKSSFEGNEKISKLFTCNSDDWACRCPEYNCKNSLEDCSKAFVEIISSPSKCGKEFPKLSALLWVLNDGRSKNSDLYSDTIHGHEEKKKNKQKSGWFRSWLNSIRVPWRKP